MAFSDVFRTFIRGVGDEIANKVQETAEVAADYVADAAEGMDGDAMDWINAATERANVKSDRAKAMSILGTSATDPESVKKAYKAKAKEMHPDKGGNPEKFAELGWARDVLLNGA